MVKVGLLSLGCAKNLMDSEIMLGHLKEAGMQFIDEPEEADVLVINTCSFINAAKRESIEAIQNAADSRAENASRQKLIVAGCLAQRFSKELPGLMAEGCKEINLISQDTTYFGMDRWDGQRPNPRSPVDSTRGESLSTLLQELNTIEGDFWIRLLYTHPAHWSDELMETIAVCDKVVKYVDMPMQHISDNMLKLMRRETDGAYIRDLIRRMREKIPHLGIRTTFIVGFPGETEADFQELMDFIDEVRFERAGVFEYSKEEGTRAEKMEGHIHHMTRRKRWNRATARLHELAETRNESMVGQTIRVLVEEKGQGRTHWDAPEIDGVVEVDPELPVGHFAEVTVQDWLGYTLYAAQ